MFLGFHLELKFAQQVFSKTNGYFDRKETSLIISLRLSGFRPVFHNQKQNFRAAKNYLFYVYGDIEDRIFRNSKETFVSLEIDNLAQEQASLLLSLALKPVDPQGKMNVFQLIFIIPCSYKCDITVCVFLKYLSQSDEK